MGRKLYIIRKNFSSARSEQDTRSFSSFYNNQDCRPYVMNIHLGGLAFRPLPPVLVQPTSKKKSYVDTTGIFLEDLGGNSVSPFLWRYLLGLDLSPYQSLVSSSIKGTPSFMVKEVASKGILFSNSSSQDG